MKRKKVYFVSGIDTDAGKSYATGYLAATWRKEEINVITQKFIQTGCENGISEDIELHRKIMGTGLFPEDLDGTTWPIHYRYPASPDLAARLEGREIDLSPAERSLCKLSEKYDTILLEGAGGLLVPICGFYTMLDYVAEKSLPLILVTNPKLGSVNHTLLSLEVCRMRNVNVDMLIYNMYPETAPEITDDTRKMLLSYLGKYHPECEFTEVPFISHI